MTLPAPPVKPDPDYGSTEQELREDLAAAYRLFALYGMTYLVYTHLSMRIPGEGHRFLVNPYGLLFEEITASSLVVVDAEGKAVQETKWPVNPAGFVIHSAVHTARDNARCVMHTHTIAGMAVAAQEGASCHSTRYRSGFMAAWRFTSTKALRQMTIFLSVSASCATSPTSLVSFCATTAC